MNSRHRRRTIIVLPDEEKAARRLLTEAITPTIGGLLSDNCHAYRRGHSVRTALDQAARAIADGYIWALDADIERYFENVRHDILLDILDRHLDDQIVQSIVRVLEHDHPNGIGLAQGCPLSPVLSNLYLCAFDHEFAGEPARVVRYSDNVLYLCRSKEAAGRARDMMGDRLADIGLRLNDKKTKIASFDKINFLGVPLAEYQERKNHDCQTISRGNRRAWAISDGGASVSWHQ